MGYLWFVLLVVFVCAGVAGGATGDFIGEQETPRVKYSYPTSRKEVDSALKNGYACGIVKKQPVCHVHLGLK